MAFKRETENCRPRERRNEGLWSTFSPPSTPSHFRPMEAWQAPPPTWPIPWVNTTEPHPWQPRNSCQPLRPPWPCPACIRVLVIWQLYSSLSQAQFPLWPLPRLRTLGVIPFLPPLLEPWRENKLNLLLEKWRIRVLLWWWLPTTTKNFMMQLQLAGRGKCKQDCKWISVLTASMLGPRAPWSRQVVWYEFQKWRNSLFLQNFQVKQLTDF